jgi:hypothetical protein
VVLYLGIGVVPYFGSGLVVPVGGVAVLWGAWLVGLVVCIRLVRHRTFWALAAPPVALGFWVAFVLAGSVLFDWTA